MKRAMILLLLFFCLNSYSFEKIVDWSKEELTTDAIFYDGKNFSSDKKNSIDIDSVSYIVFNLEEEKNIEKGSSKEQVLKNVDVEELLRRSKYMEEKYPDSSLLVLHDDGIQRLNKDGSQYMRSRYSVKIMNEKELSYSMMSLYHLEGKFESKIIMARSISPDGKTSYLDLSDTAYTSPKQGLSFFSGRKDEQILKATIPDVKVGSIVDFEYETLDLSPEDKNQFYAKWFFGGDDPVYSSTVEYIVPLEKEIFWVAKNFEPFNSDPKITEKDGYRIYFFSRGESPPFVKEPYSSPLGDLIPFVFGSVFKDQTYLSEWLSKFINERMESSDIMEAMTYAVLEKANAISEEESISALYRFVQEYIHYRSIKTSLSSSYSGHPAFETFENRYGDCIDKSILFSTMLGIAGIDAYPVIISTNDNPSSLFNEIGIISGNHAITEIHLKEKEEKIIYLDSTSATYRYPVFRSDDQKVQAWNPLLNTVRIVTPLPPIWNTQDFDKEIVLSSEGDGEVRNFNLYSGDLEAGLREYFLSVKEQEIESILRSIVGRDHPGSTLKEYKYKDPIDYNDNFYLEFSYTVKGIAKRTGDFLVMNIPVNYSFDFVTLKERKYPLVFPTSSGNKHKVSIKLPEGHRVKGLPSSISIENRYFKYYGKYFFDKKNNKIIFEDHFEREGSNVSVKEYKKFREDILKVDHFIRIPLVIEKKE